MDFVFFNEFYFKKNKKLNFSVLKRKREKKEIKMKKWFYKIYVFNNLNYRKYVLINI